MTAIWNGPSLRSRKQALAMPRAGSRDVEGERPGSLGGITEACRHLRIQLNCAGHDLRLWLASPRSGVPGAAAPTASLPSGGCLNRGASKLLRTSTTVETHRATGFRPGLIHAMVAIVSLRAHSVVPPGGWILQGNTCDGHCRPNSRLKVEVHCRGRWPVSRAQAEPGATGVAIQGCRESEHLLG